VTVKPRSYWMEKTVIVTGASSGLGFQLAKAFHDGRANVVLAARTEATLAAAAEKLGGGAGRVLPITCDVTRDADVENLIARTIAEFGRLDCLVNNAGLSVRKRVIDTTPDDFRELMELNLIATVRSTRAAMPHLLSAQGHLVNIGSLSGKTASRYFGAYPASKFAVSAYSQQLRLELGPEGLHVLLVCPGPIARDDARVRSPEELAGLPESARKPGAGVKTKAIRPELLAAKILAACESRKPELIVPWKARILFTLQQLSPRLGDWLVRKMT
jgi:short-subunit dehydrogenase